MTGHGINKRRGLATSVYVAIQADTHREWFEDLNAAQVGEVVMKELEPLPPEVQAAVDHYDKAAQLEPPLLIDTRRRVF